MAIGTTDAIGNTFQNEESHESKSFSIANGNTHYIVFYLPNLKHRFAHSY